ncbi:hypothetical protein [Methylobacterium sp. J-070]|uniref:hypothetical protein n=1 Tax=Methylobacterium sp. J-070 TaxID=2836650 RepID=UPI001FBBB93D|nr:hypothetical protein [Methylobacterium sp. J-070]MCJ2051026.1 hypothetical protein [Methylobacterium sp. J-070]
MLGFLALRQRQWVRTWVGPRGKVIEPALQQIRSPGMPVERPFSPSQPTETEASIPQPSDDPAPALVRRRGLFSRKTFVAGRSRVLVLAKHFIVGEARLGPDPVQAARIIAENVASAVERSWKGKPFYAGDRKIIVADFMRELLPGLLAEDKGTLVEDCNRHIVIVAEVGIRGPRVEAVEPDDGSLTTRQE